MKSDLIDVDVYVKHETPLAWLIHTGDSRAAVWVPKSQCEVEKHGPDGFATATMREMTAQDKGLI